MLNRKPSEIHLVLMSSMWEVQVWCTMWLSIFLDMVLILRTWKPILKRCLQVSTSNICLLMCDTCLLFRYLVILSWVTLISSCIFIREYRECWGLSLLYAGLTSESSHCFRKGNRNSGCRLCIMVCPSFWEDYYMLIYTHHWELMNSVGSHGSLSLPFGMKVTVCHFVSNSHEVMTALIVVLPLIVVVEIFLQLHQSLSLLYNILIG